MVSEAVSVSAERHSVRPLRHTECREPEYGHGRRPRSNGAWGRPTAHAVAIRLRAPAAVPSGTRPRGRSRGRERSRATVVMASVAMTSAAIARWPWR